MVALIVSFTSDLLSILTAKIAGDEWAVHNSNKRRAAGHNVASPNSASFCHHEFRRLFEWARERWGTMREEFASNSFLAVAVAGLVLLFSGLIALAMI